MPAAIWLRIASRTAGSSAFSGAQLTGASAALWRIRLFSVHEAYAPPSDPSCCCTSGSMLPALYTEPVSPTWALRLGRYAERAARTWRFAVPVPARAAISSGLASRAAATSASACQRGSNSSNRLVSCVPSGSTPPISRPSRSSSVA